MKHQVEPTQTDFLYWQQRRVTEVVRHDRSNPHALPKSLWLWLAERTSGRHAATGTHCVLCTRMCDAFKNAPLVTPWPAKKPVRDKQVANTVSYPEDQCLLQLRRTCIMTSSDLLRGRHVQRRVMRAGVTPLVTEFGQNNKPIEIWSTTPTKMEILANQ